MLIIWLFANILQDIYSSQDKSRSCFVNIWKLLEAVFKGDSFFRLTQHIQGMSLSRCARIESYTNISVSISLFMQKARFLFTVTIGTYAVTHIKARMIPWYPRTCDSNIPCFATAVLEVTKNNQIHYNYSSYFGLSSIKITSQISLFVHVGKCVFQKRGLCSLCLTAQSTIKHR